MKIITVLPTIQVAKNAAKAASRVIVAATTGQPIFTSKAVQSAREKTCQACEHNLKGHCQLCGCSTCGRIVNKTRLVTEKCPANKWPLTPP